MNVIRGLEAEETSTTKYENSEIKGVYEMLY